MAITISSLYQKTNLALREFCRDNRGSAAVEFVFIAPLLITLYLGTMEISQGIEVDKKVGRSASIIGDLIAQTNTTIPNADVQDILKIGASVLQPYTRTLPTITITGITIDGAGTATVKWSKRRTGTTYSTPFAANVPVTTVPANLKVANTFLIRVETSLEYLPITSWSIKKNKQVGTPTAYAAMDMKETYYMRPRVSDDVSCTGC